MNFKPISNSGSFSTAQKQALAKVLRSIEAGEGGGNLNVPQPYTMHLEPEASTTDIVDAFTYLVQALASAGILQTEN